MNIWTNIFAFSSIIEGIMIFILCVNRLTLLKQIWNLQRVNKESKTDLQKLKETLDKFS